MMFGHCVEIVAKNFFDFIGLVVSLKDVTRLECISYFDRQRFLDNYIEKIQNEPYYSTPKVKKALEALSDAFPSALSLKSVDDVYTYVKDLQNGTVPVDFDGTVEIELISWVSSIPEMTIEI